LLHSAVSKRDMSLLLHSVVPAEEGRSSKSLARCVQISLGCTFYAWTLTLDLPDALAYTQTVLGSRTRSRHTTAPTQTLTYIHSPSRILSHSLPPIPISRLRKEACSAAPRTKLTWRIFTLHPPLMFLLHHLACVHFFRSTTNTNFFFSQWRDACVRAFFLLVDYVHLLNGVFSSSCVLFLFHGGSREGGGAYTIAQPIQR